MQRTVFARHATDSLTVRESGYSREPSSTESTNPREVNKKHFKSRPLSFRLYF